MGLGEDLPELPDHLSRPIVAAENRRLPAEQSGESRMPLDLGIEQLHGRLHVALLEALNPAIEDVNVLLRHRPRSIPRERAAFHVKQVAGAEAHKTPFLRQLFSSFSFRLIVLAALPAAL